MVPLIIGLAIPLSLRTRQPLVRALLYNDQVLNTGRIQQALDERGNQAGFDALHVPYKGLALALPDLLAGRVQMTFTGYPAVAPYVNTGKFKMLATVGARSTR